MRFINKDVPRNLWPVRRQSLDLTPQGCRVPTISPGRLAEACSFLVRLHVRQVESIWKNDCLCRLLRLQVTPANGGLCLGMTHGPAAPRVAKLAVRLADPSISGLVRFAYGRLAELETNIILMLRTINLTYVSCSFSVLKT